MANFPKMKLTNVGLQLLANVQAGADNLTFTKTALGDGTTDAPVTSLTALVSPKVEIAITEGKQVGTSTYQIAAFFSNAEVTTGFWWREIGVFAKGNDGKEILYCYSNAGDASDYIPVGSDERVEKYIYQSLAIGNAESVTAEINASDSFILAVDKGKAGGVAPLGTDGKVETKYLPEMDYASTARVVKIESDLSTHLSVSNPHGITATTVGLDKVPNVATNDQTPTYTEASTLATLTSGEKISVAFGKIKKAITDLISHLADTTKHITSAERTSWNGKAPNSHASTATTYGVGTSSNYGHLKITDSKTSTATDTAASAKALKEVNDAAQSGTWKLLKEMSVNLVTTQGTMELNITGLTNLKIEQLKLEFEGTLSFTHLRDSTVSNNISIYFGDDNTANLMYRYSTDSFTNGTNISTSLFLRQIQYKGVHSNVDEHSFTTLNGNSMNYVSPNSCKLIMVTTNTTFMKPTLAGTLKIYTRGD